MVTLEIDGKPVSVSSGSTIYEAARQIGIAVPVLCHTPANGNLKPVGVCRVCCVQVQMKQKDGTVGPPGRVYTAACMKTCDEGMVITTGVDASGVDAKPATAFEDGKRQGQALEVESARKTLVELLMSEHPQPCARHKEHGDCELEVLADKMGATRPIFTPRAFSKGTDFSNPSIAIDHSACILCDRCVRACGSVENDVIGRMGKGANSAISFDANKPMGDSSCVNCGECMINCPTGAITYSGPVKTELQTGSSLSVEELKRVPMFARISSAFLERSLGGVVRKTYRKGEVLCRQGDFGSTAFYIERGKVDVFLETELSHVKTRAESGGLFKRVTSLLMTRSGSSAKESHASTYIPTDSGVDLEYDKPIAQVGQGEIIGEASCLNFQPRSATVRAAEETVVLEMLRNAFDILRRNRQFKAEMEDKYRARALQNHLRSVTVFRDLPDEFIEQLRTKVELVPFGPGENICHQGERADAFYLVRMGHVKVTETYADGQSIVLSYLSRGQYFGEMGLLGGEVRSATCSALDHVEVVRISAGDFDEMMRQFPHIKARLEEVAHARAAANKLRATEKTMSLPQYIDQGLYQAQSLLILDLEKCTRCDECVRACAQAHNGVTRLIRDGVRYDKYLVTTACRSCRDPLCMVGCPVGSIRRKNDLEIIIEDWCIGCGRCAEQCPYGNINMHPFNVKVEDPSTGEVRLAERSKAAVCDLCTDQCLGENEVPSCVYACPHDAAHRVDGQTFFDVQLLGTNLAKEKLPAVGSA